MKVLHIITSSETGGAEIALEKLIKFHISSSKYFHKVISLKPLGDVGDRLRNEGIEVTSLHLKSFLFLPFSFFKLLFLIKKQKPDLIQTWLYHADLIGSFASFLLGFKKIIWNIRSSDALLGKGLSVSGYLSMKLCALISHHIPHTIISVAERAKDQHLKQGYCENKFKVIQNGFSLEEFNPKLGVTKNLREKIDLMQGFKIIGSVGRYNEYKDYKTLIAASEIMLSKRKDILFVLIGEGLEDSNKELRELLINHGVDNNFRLLGKRNSINELILLFDVFCLHSVSEGFPNVLGEAMSSGIPCVSTDAGDAGILLGDTGRLVEVGQPKQLSKALLEVLDLPPEKIKEISKLGRERIKSRFSINRIVKKYEELYEEISMS